MGVDLVAAGLLGLFTLVGYWTGFVRQILRLIGVVLAYLLSRALAAPLSGPVASLTGLCEPFAKVAANGGLFLLFYIALSIVASFIARRYRKDAEARAIDSGLGALTGFVKGGLILYVVACLMALFGSTGATGASTLRSWQEESNALQFAANHNALAGFDVVKSITALARAAHDREALTRIALDPRLHDMKELQQPEVVAALRSNDLLAICHKVDIEALAKRLAEIAANPASEKPRSPDAGATTRSSSN